MYVSYTQWDVQKKRNFIFIAFKRTNFFNQMRRMSRHLCFGICPTLEHDCDLLAASSGRSLRHWLLSSGITHLSFVQGNHFFSQYYSCGYDWSQMLIGAKRSHQYCAHMFFVRSHSHQVF